MNSINITPINISELGQLIPIDLIPVSECLAYTDHLRKDYRFLAIVLIIALILLIIYSYKIYIKN